MTDARSDTEVRVPPTMEALDDFVDAAVPTGRSAIDLRAYVDAQDVLRGAIRRDAAERDRLRSVLAVAENGLREALIDVGAKGCDDPGGMRGARIGSEALAAVREALNGRPHAEARTDG